MKKQHNEAVLSKLTRIETLLEEQKRRPLNLVEAANYLSISQSHLYRLTSQRKIPSHKPNGKYLYFFADELNEWVQNNEIRPKDGGQELSVFASKDEATPDRESVFASENEATPDKESVFASKDEATPDGESDFALEDEASSDEEPP